MSIKKNVMLVSQNESFLIQILGFQSRHDYGEIYIKDSTSKTFTFRGYDRRKVMKDARKELLLLKISN
ncbi:hypothetical protein LCM10_04865 [Rossellomorea aquimaris]|uniref:hypothetical protein n=1 Tax=Rossellomorea aquimaris TaxID=189382 RepID=UPI001CD1CCAF|nr:hypothetical protein [Rossellomorea aquimaris]MCA1054310.1 hypothetical protein [Rossellomorea aquimaris]